MMPLIDAVVEFVSPPKRLVALNGGSEVVRRVLDSADIRPDDSVVANEEFGERQSEALQLHSMINTQLGARVTDKERRYALDEHDDALDEWRAATIDNVRRGRRCCNSFSIFLFVFLYTFFFFFNNIKTSFFSISL